MANDASNDQPSLERRSKSKQAKSGFVFPWQRWDVIASTSILNLFALAIPLLVLQICDRIMPDQAYRSLVFMGIGIGAALILEAILHHSRGHVLSWLGMHFEHGGAVGAFHHLVYAAEEDLTKHQVEKSVEAIESMARLKEFLIGQGFLILLDLPFSLLFLGVIACFSFQIAIVVLVIAVVFVCLIWGVGRKLDKHLGHQVDVNERRYTFILETLSNHHTLKALGMESLLMRSYERLHHDCAKANYHVSLYSAKARSLSNLLGYLLFIGCVSIAALQVMNETITLGIMAACLILTNRIMEPIQTAMGIWMRFKYFEIARKRVGEHFGLTLGLPCKRGISKPIHGKLTLEGVSFQYAEDKPYLLDGVNLTIQPGSIITIQGDNGIGKTTLMGLLMGNLHPTSGAVLIDDVLLTDYDHRDLRRQMACIPPKGILFQGTILENMTLYRGAAYGEDAMRFSRQLGLEAWIRRLPLGYDTKIGDSLFLSLPDGIQQRICLVRALVNCPKILILDEANTSLDKEGDQLLRQVLQNLRHQVTIIFITHRPAIQELADASYELKDGMLTFKPLLFTPKNKKIERQVLQINQFVKPRKRSKISSFESSPSVLYKIAGARS